MIKDATSSSYSTRTWAWILTFHIYACSIACTIRMDSTFRSAIRWTANECRLTWTRWNITNVSTLSIWPTRWWNTWISNNRWCFNWKYKNLLPLHYWVVVFMVLLYKNISLLLTFDWITESERISSVRCFTRTYRTVIYYFTIGIDTARSGTRIYTFTVHTSFFMWALGAYYTFRATVRRRSFIAH